MNKKNTLEDVWKRIEIRGENDCWLWQGITARYGRIRIGRGYIGVHVAAYLTRKGTIAAGLQVQHICNIKKCCNPKHLTLGDERQNAYYAIACNTPWGKGPGKSRVKGVHPLSRIPGYWNARGDKIDGSSLCLYSGTDFFEAACARKSWEVLRKKYLNQLKEAV